jgi:cell division protein ZapE
MMLLVARTMSSSSTPSSTGPSLLGPVRSRLAGLVSSGDLREDPRQIAAASVLDNFLEERHSGPRSSSSSSKLSFFSSLFSRRSSAKDGVYLYGGVGTGKTMMMDMFFQEWKLTTKRRTHFHNFMLEAHAKIHELKKAGSGHPVEGLAAHISSKTGLLCFDEFQVTDIADAMILKHLFDSLKSKGCLFVLTSNRPPDDLYLNGIQRQSFLPFIEMVKQDFYVHDIDSEVDYRRSARESTAAASPEAAGPTRSADTQWVRALRRRARLPEPIYLHGEDSAEEVRAVFKDLTGVASGEPGAVDVMMGRTLKVSEMSGRVALFTFEELCERPLGAADYLSIAAHFDVVILTAVPRMDQHKRDLARRLTVLIDVLYEHRIKLVVQAAAAPDNLFKDDKSTTDIGFAFDRTISRLTEMQSVRYLKEDMISPHKAE